MGSYLDKPETSKKSLDEENDYFFCGSSSMQGWRVNQEDAHNTIPNFDANTAFFAVYDGHGGSEVAEYCSMKLPDFLKGLESFKSGNFEQALREAFLGFDSTLLEDAVIEELKQLAKKNPDYEDEDMDEDDETAEEIVNLQREATMPLSEVLEKYKGNTEKIQQIQTVQKLIEMASKSGGSQAAGSSLQGHSSSSAGPSSSSSTSQPSASSSSSVPKKSASENEVSSSCSKEVSGSEADIAEPSSSSAAATNEQAPPDSTDIIPKLDTDSQSSTTAKANETSQNGAISGSDCKSTAAQKSSDDETISSSSAQENGESAASCPTSSQSVSAGGSSAAPAGSDLPTPKSQKIPNNISSSSLSDTESESSDDELDETYKESQKEKPVNSDGDTTEEEVDEECDEELEDEEISDEEEDVDTFDDEFINNMETGPGKASGCTAVVALINGRELYVANAGDSRCIVCRGGRVMEMSFDHKPEDEIELNRIKKAGGRVSLDGRVNGGLNLSRAIGDHGYKNNKELSAEEQMITALPDLQRLTLTPEDEFMVLACDGIWNFMSNEEVIGYVKQRIDAGKLSLSGICEELFHNCLAPNTIGDGTGCDNMTAIIVKFKPKLFGQPAENSSDEPSTQVQTSRKRSLDDAEAEAVPAAEKRPKIEDDLTPDAAVDTSTA